MDKLYLTEKNIIQLRKKYGMNKMWFILPGANTIVAFCKFKNLTGTEIDLCIHNLFKDNKCITPYPNYNVLSKIFMDIVAHDIPSATLKIKKNIKKDIKIYKNKKLKEIQQVSKALEYIKV